MSENLNKSVKNATKWSAITEIASKLLTPIVSMVLARLLAPEAFGVVTTLTMIITFAEIFTDAGFQKYLVQHQFVDERDRDESINVAFWSNLVISLLIWGIITLFADSLATLVGNPGLGHVLVVACASIPLAAFSSIQMALYKRDFDFKTLFKVRIVGILIPLVITVPLAFWIRSYWSLVIGTLAVNFSNTVLLTWFSKWKPRFFYSWLKLKEMLSFTMWSLVEAVSIWLTNYVDVFIVGTMLSQYYLGLYKTSSTLVAQIMGLILAITSPILFSALSRLQDDEKEFQRLFFHFQKIVSILVIPLGVGIFLFSDLVTTIVLGEQWIEASGFVGLWALTSGFTIVLSYYASEVYRAKGKPNLSALAQIFHVIVLWPVVLITVRYGFEVLYIARSLVRLELILVNLIVLWVAINISPAKMFRNIYPSCLSSIVMVGVFYLLPETDLIWKQFIYVGICGFSYLLSISLFKEERGILFNLKSIIKR
ncbi:MAG: lipopolysaccharide biosynthesis protein [Lachnospiraceae bacterium]|nr:lipopolysaccharide biosynthesis protein [Lachnospiraceae bacterium]